MLLLWVCIIGGNIAVICSYVYWKDVHSKTRFKIIISLAIADILYALFVVSFDLIYTLWNEWYFSRPYCVIWRILDVALSTTSYIHLSLLSLDQFLNLYKPLSIISNKSKRMRIYNICICLIWFYSFTYSSTSMLVNTDYFRWSMSADYIVLDHSSSINLTENIYGNESIIIRKFCPFVITEGHIILFTTSFFIFMFINIILCAAIVVVLVKNNTTIFNKSSLTPAMQHLKMRKTIGAIKFVIAMVIFFLLCWLPFFILLSLQPYLKRNAYKQPVWLFNLLLWIAYINSAINPVLYFFMHYEVRTRLKLAITRKKCLAFLEIS
ncbi:unnamed protein product [Gordionus sp. m RMFG-2023]